MNTECEYLEVHLAHLRPFLTGGITEVMVNKPGEAYTEEGGEMRRHLVPELTFERLVSLSEQAASFAKQPGITSDYPMVVADLPTGERLQCILPPATEPGRVVLSIRRQIIRDLTLDEYFAHDHAGIQHLESIKEAIRQKRNGVIIGGTSSGKSTFLNACLREIPMSERIVTIEDIRELRLHQPNVVPLLFPRRAATQIKNHSSRDLVQATLRVRPDRIIFGELRGAETFDFFDAANTGHPGIWATLHADSAAMAIKRLTMMVLQANTGMTVSDIETYIRATIDVIIHVGRKGPGTWGVKDIYLEGES